MFTATEVGVDLTGEDGILGHVRVARVFVQREQQQPRNADDDAEGGQVRRHIQQTTIVPETQQSCFCFGSALIHVSVKHTA